jgi:excisionase family DNA binding protein
MTPEQRTEKLWSVRELSEFLGIPVDTIYQWRSQGYGPIGRRMGKYVRFRPSDVFAWVAAQDERAS